MAPLQSPHALLLLGALTLGGLSGAQPFLPDAPPSPPAKQVKNEQEFTVKMAQVSAAPTTEAALALLGKLFPDEDFSALAKELSFLSKNASRPMKLPRWPVDLRWRLGERRLFVISSDPYLSQSWTEPGGGSMAQFLFPHQQKDWEAPLTLKSLQRLCDAGRRVRGGAKGKQAVREEVQVNMHLERSELNPTHPYAERVLAGALRDLHPSDKVMMLEKELTRLKLGRCALRDWYQASQR